MVFLFPLKLWVIVKAMVFVKIILYNYILQTIKVLQQSHKYDIIVINKKIAEGEANETNNISFVNLDFFIWIIELHF